MRRGFRQNARIKPRPYGQLSKTSNVTDIMKIAYLPIIAIVLGLAGTALEAKEKKAKGEGKPGEAYNADEVVKKFDKNADGKLSLEEFSAMAKWKKEADPAGAAKKAFEQIDANHDNSVTADELKAAHEKKVNTPKTEKKPETTPAKPEEKK